MHKNAGNLKRVLRNVDIRHIDGISEVLLLRAAPGFNHIVLLPHRLDDEVVSSYPGISGFRRETISDAVAECLNQDWSKVLCLSNTKFVCVLNR